MKRYLLLLTLLAHTCIADEARWYMVNVTIFAQGGAQQEELFDSGVLSNNVADVIQLDSQPSRDKTSAATSAPILLHHNKNSGNGAYLLQTLSPEWQGLNRKLENGKQTILFTGQWQQPMYDEKNALPIYLESTRTTDGLPALRGLFTISIAKFLQSQFELTYLNKTGEKTEQTLIKTTRRMRSGEIHYIDHPLVGILIKYTPVGGK
ncbi:MAG: hypothetical protein H7A08_01310 [Oceanospirillaceae bacterium]|nr:hypothetical protein [Oceanospirillaceae bacterium]MCP5350598.1 hypothetical protein [Oceanospirillaceae bacterium]